MPVLANNEYYEAETQEEFKKARTKSGVHLFNPKTPLEIQLPGGIQKFTNILMEATFRKDMKNVVYEWWWSKKMDFPLFEVTSEQYKDGCLNYSVEDYVEKSQEVENKDFCYVLGEETLTTFLYDVTDRYLVMRINGRYALFENLKRFDDATFYDRFFIKGEVDIKVIRLLYEDPLPVPLSLPLSSAGIQKGDRYEIKAKNPRNAKEFFLVFGDQSLEIPLYGEHDEVILEVTGVERGRCTAKLNGAELPDVISQGPFLTDRMVLEGDLDFHWVAIVKPDVDEGEAEGSNKSQPENEGVEKSSTDKA